MGSGIFPNEDSAQNEIILAELYDAQIEGIF